MGDLEPPPFDPQMVGARAHPSHNRRWLTGIGRGPQRIERQLWGKYVEIKAVMDNGESDNMSINNVY